MNKFLTILGAFALLLGIAAGVQAATVTLTFDEIAAWNATPAGGGKWVTEEFASMGIHFVPNSNQGNQQDGVLYDSGVLSGLVTDGTQYLGVASTHPDGGTSIGGPVIRFDTKQTLITFDVIGLSATSGAIWLFDGTPQWTGDEVWATNWTVPTGSAATITAGDGSTQFDHAVIATTFFGATTAAFDDITFEGTAYVPIPASVLLLGTGLIPLFRLRRRS